MKKILLLGLILVSCKNEDKYEVTLEQYVREDLHFKQARIDLQLELLRNKSFELPEKYTNVYYEANFINEQCLHFERKALKMENTDSLNILFRRLKDSILSAKFFENKFIIDEINKLPENLENSIDKYNLLRTLKEINFKVNHIVLDSGFSTGVNGISPSSVLAIRLNKNQVALNIFSNIRNKFPDDFDSESFKLLNIEDLQNNAIPVSRYDNDLIKSIIIETQSDTIFFDAIIHTRQETGLLVSENKSPIIVGELKTFDRNNLKEYMDFYLNK